MKKHLFLFPMAILAVAFLSLTGCSNSSSSLPKSNYLAVQIDNGTSWSIINEDGEVVVKEEYSADDAVSKIVDDSYWVKSGEKFQLYNINSPKKPVTNDEWDYATEMALNRALVAKAGEPIQIIDEDGKTVATFSKDVVKAYRQMGKTIRIKKVDGSYGLANLDGKIILEGIYDVELGDGEIAAVAHKKEGDSKYTIYDSKGNETGSFSADEVIIVRGEYISARKGEKAVLLNKNGDVAIESKKYTLISPPIDGLCITVNSDGKSGIVDLKGEEVIRTKYNMIGPINNSAFIAVKEEKFGVINENDEEIVEFDFDSANPLGNNILLKDGSTWIIMGLDGKRVGKMEFDKICSSPCVEEISYINVDALAEVLQEIIPELNSNTTIAQMAQKLGEKASDEYGWTNHFEVEKTIAGQKVTIQYEFGDYLSEEKFHEETVNDGWFDEVKQVSDGWGWKESNMCRLNIFFPLIDGDIDATISILANRMKQNGYDVNNVGHPKLTKDNLVIEMIDSDNGISVNITIE